MIQDRWLLPQGIEEILPPCAAHLETLRRQILDLYASWGYELIIPPLIEFLESLLSGVGDDLDLQTFKFTDQLSGRMLGVRADMTTQVARIDAHCLQRDEPVRLCYMEPVLRTRADGFGGSRSPYQAGVELYGHSGSASDLEVLLLMLETLRVAGVRDVHVDLGHVAIFRSLVQQAQLDTAQERRLFDALQRKALPEIDAQLAAFPEAVRTPLRALASLHGGVEVLEQAATLLPTQCPELAAALHTLDAIATALAAHHPSLPLHIDLAELRGYHYHTGLVFSAYVAAQGSAVAQGGRYDEIGQVFGRARPATGFSTDVANLLRLGAPLHLPTAAIYAPPLSNDTALEEKVSALRHHGERVIRALPGTPSRAAPGDRALVAEHGQWVVVALPNTAT